MKIDVLTLFPRMFVGPLDESIIRRAREAGRLELALHICEITRLIAIRRWTIGHLAAGQACY